MTVTSLSTRGNPEKLPRGIDYTVVVREDVFVCVSGPESSEPLGCAEFEGEPTPTSHSCTRPTPPRISEVLNTPHILLRHALSRHPGIISVKCRRRNPETLGECYRTPQILCLPYTQIFQSIVRQSLSTIVGISTTNIERGVIAVPPCSKKHFS